MIWERFPATRWEIEVNALCSFLLRLTEFGRDR